MLGRLAGQQSEVLEQVREVVLGWFNAVVVMAMRLFEGVYRRDGRDLFRGVHAACTQPVAR